MDNNEHEHGAAPSTLPTTSINHSGKSSDPTPGPGTPKSDRRSPGASAHQDEITIPHPPILSARSPVHFVLDNFFFATSLISLTIFIIFFIATWFTVLQDARSMNDRVLSNATGVSILGNSLQLDLDACVLSISWKVVVCGATTTSGNPLWDDCRIPTHCEPFNEALDVYLDDSSEPIFSFVPYTDLMSRRPGLWDPPGFITEHRVNKHGKWDPTKDLLVPFQRYSFNAFAFAIDPITNRSVHIAKFGILDVLHDFVVRSHDVADTRMFTYDSGKGLVTTEVESHLLRAEITRSAIAKAVATSMFLINWALTVGSVYITALVVSGKLEASSVIAVLPFSALLAIPAVRSLYIDSPPFRISIDAVAFFVQIATVGLCSPILLRALTSYRPPQSPPTEFSV